MPVSSISRRRFAQAAAGAAATVGLPLLAQGTWPSRPIRIVVPYTPGGFTDQMARIVQIGLQKNLNQTVTIDNKPGANSIIGNDAVANAQPDGYTFLFTPSSAIAINPILQAKMPYDTLNDLLPVAQIGAAGILLVDKVWNRVPMIIYVNR